MNKPTPDEITTFGAVFAACATIAAVLITLLVMAALTGCEDSRAILMRGQVFDDPRQHNEPQGDALPAPKTAQERVEEQYLGPVKERKFAENLNSF